MSDAFRQKQAELMATTVAKNDIVICTALVMGRRAPVIVTQPMVDSMKRRQRHRRPRRRGRRQLRRDRSRRGVTTPNGVTVLGYSNWPGRIPVAASALYARNLLTFLTTFWDKEAQAPKLPETDDIVQGRHADPRRRRSFTRNFQPAQAA